MVNLINSRSETHIHKLCFCVHLQATKNWRFDLKFNNELFAFILRISFQSFVYFFFILRSQLLGGNDSYFLFFVELLIELQIFFSNFLNVHQSLILSQYFNESYCGFMVISCWLKTFIKLLDFSHTNTSILCEKSEAFTVFI